MTGWCMYIYMSVCVLGGGGGNFELLGYYLNSLFGSLLMYEVVMYYSDNFATHSGLVHDVTDTAGHTFSSSVNLVPGSS